MPNIHPFLWFDTGAEEAAEFYVSIFPNSHISEVARYGEGDPGTEGSVMTVRFSLDGTEMTALNGGPAHSGFNVGISLVIDCKSADEVDHYWSALTDGGEESACGWLKDRYGLSWQVVPDGLSALLGDPDPGRAARATRAMMGMKKLDLLAMAAAADQTTDGTVSVSRRIAAPQRDIFAWLVDPVRHPDFDGSHMLRDGAGNPAISAVGDVFTMKMFNDEMGDYEMHNHVVEYVQDERILWEPVLMAASREEDRSDIGQRHGHRWGYELRPDASGGSVVTEIFDCSRAPDDLRAAVRDGTLWLPVMEATLQLLDAQFLEGQFLEGQLSKRHNPDGSGDPVQDAGDRASV